MLTRLPGRLNEKPDTNIKQVPSDLVAGRLDIVFAVVVAPSRGVNL